MKKILTSSIITSFIILTFVINPSTTEASWWNPGTWFNNWTFNSVKVEQIKKTDNDIPVAASKLENDSNKNLPSGKTNVKTTSQIATSTSISSIPSIKKCTDNVCFVNAIKSCSNNTQYQTNSSIEYLGSSIKSKINFSISKSGNSCLLSLNPISYSIAPSQGLVDSRNGAQIIGSSPSDIYPKLNSDAQTKIVGKKGVCNITKISDRDEIVSLMNKNSELFMLLDPANDICSGDLFVSPEKKVVSAVPKTMNDCKNIRFRDDFENCVKPIVKTVGDCSVFSSDFFDKELCIKQLAIKQKDVSICASVAGSDTNSSTQSDCYAEIAILKNDPKICGENNFKKNNQQTISSMSLQCVNKYCGSNISNKWWGCGN